MPIEAPPPGTSLVLDSDVSQDWRFGQRNIVTAIRDYRLRFQTVPALTSMTVFEALRGFENVEVKGLSDEAREQPAMQLNN